MKKHIIALSIVSSMIGLSCSTEELDQLQNTSDENVNNTVEKRVRPIVPAPVFAHQGGCGTTIPTKTPVWVNDDYSQYTSSFSPLPPLNIHVKYHIVRKSDGTDGIPLSDLDIMTQQLNDDFEQPLYGCIAFNHSPSRIRFLNDRDVNYIDISSYQIISTSTSDTSLIAPEYDALILEDNNETDLNVYVIKGFEVPSSVQIYSKAVMNGNSVVVAREENAHKSPHLTHGVGHNLGLYHTWHRNNVCDLKTRPCDGTIGDFIEDTPIVNSTTYLSINERCEYYRYTASSCNGTTIQIPKANAIFNAKNIMSRKPLRSDCRIGFTAVQHLRLNQTAINLGLTQEESPFAK